MNNNIPAKIVLYYDKGPSQIPSYVVKNLQKLNPGHEIVLFEDSSARKFIKDNYSSKHTEWYTNQREPCFKADFFRYCYLYKLGGYYFDIDVEPLVPVQSYINYKTTLFSNLSNIHDRNNRTHSICQALLFSTPGNDIIYRAIGGLLHHSPQQLLKSIGKVRSDCAQGQLHPCRQLYMYVNQTIPTAKFPGMYIKQDHCIQLAEEIKHCNRYKFTYAGETIANAQYTDYIPRWEKNGGRFTNK